MRLSPSLQTRLVSSHLLVSIISIILIAGFAGGTIFRSARVDIEHNLEDLAFVTSNPLESALEDYASGKVDAEAVRNSMERMLARHPSVEYDVFLPDLSLLVSNSDKPLQKADKVTAPEVLLALNGANGEGERQGTDSSGQQVFYQAVRLQRSDQVLGILRLCSPLDAALAATRRSLLLLLGVSLLVAIGVSVFGWLLANSLTYPIAQVTQTAERLASGEMSARVQPTGPHELHRMAVAFNTMAGRIETHVGELRAFVANASHELRTPLTVVKLRVEALRNGALEEPPIAGQFLEDIENEVDRLVLMVNNLLDLSRMEAGLAPVSSNTVRLSAIATDVYETFSIRAARAGLDFELDLDPDLPAVSGNEDQLRRVLYNLVENAIKFTPQGGQVRLYLRPGRKGKTVRVLVRDTGLGISSHDLPHIFERFYRVEATRPRYSTQRGSGLGLAIAKSIVENHGGKIGVSSQLSKGTTFWVELPAAAVEVRQRHRQPA